VQCCSLSVVGSFTTSQQGAFNSEAIIEASSRSDRLDLLASQATSIFGRARRQATQSIHPTGFLVHRGNTTRSKYRTYIYLLRKRRIVRPSSLNASAPLVYQTSKPESGRIRLELDAMLSLLFVSSVSVRKKHAASQRMPSSLRLLTRTVVPNSICALLRICRRQCDAIVSCVSV
jgi:hypothetical protein